MHYGISGRHRRAGIGLHGVGLHGVVTALIFCSALVAGCARPKPPQPPERPQPPEVLPPEPEPPEPEPEATSPAPPTPPEEPPPAPGASGAGLAGIASWYGPRFHGRRTASGERFDQRALTAAHATLRLGTRVRVTNLDNGRAVVVRINDRTGDTDRVIDLSRAAGEQIGLIRPGVAPVRIEVLEPADEPSWPRAGGPE